MLSLTWIAALAVGCITHVVDDTTCYYDELKRAEQACVEYGGVFEGESASLEGVDCETTALPSMGDVQECLLLLSDTCSVSCTLSGGDTG